MYPGAQTERMILIQTRPDHQSGLYLPVQSLNRDARSFRSLGERFHNSGDRLRLLQPAEQEVRQRTALPAFFDRGAVKASQLSGQRERIETRQILGGDRGCGWQRQTRGASQGSMSLPE